MLEWARKSARLEIDDVAKAEKLRPEEIAEWENGHGTPSLAVLGRLARRYKRPLMVFYLPEPPTGFNVVNDFRRLRPNGQPQFSSELQFAIRAAQERQAWAAELLSDRGEKKNDLVGSLSMLRANVKTTAKRLRDRLGVSLHDQVTCHGESAAFSLWKAHTEMLGVFVFQASRVPVNEMRGCALSDDVAPAVVVNMNDSFSARSFTLIHEIVHILLGNSAVTALSHSPAMSEAERFCNKVAAEVLIPTSDLLSRLPKKWEQNADSIISSAAERYRVSRLAVLLKLADEGAVDSEFVNANWGPYSSVPERKKGGRVPPYLRSLRRHGDMFSRLVISAYHAEQIHGGALSDLLGLKLKYLPKLLKTLYPSIVLQRSNV